ncbi:MAG: hypothetical protein ACXQT4_04480 [Methanotrichaceae archaeon]
MASSYEFLIDLRRLMVAYRRFERILYLLNAAIIGIVIYVIVLSLGVPAFFRFYWQDFTPLAEAPAIISIFLGLCGAELVKRRSNSDLFQLFDFDISEKAKTAYDNRRSDSILMQRLAKDVKRSLSAVGCSDLINNYRFTMREKSVPVLYLKSSAVILLLGSTIIFSQSQMGEEISPADFQSLADLKDKATDLFQEEDQTDRGLSSPGLSGEIYGKPSLAVLEEVNLELLLFPGAGAGFRSKETEPTDYFFQAAAPGDGVAVPTELYIESLPPRHKDIIKQYFENLAKS